MIINSSQTPKGRRTADSLRMLATDSNVTKQQLILATRMMLDAATFATDEEDTGWRTTKGGKHYKIDGEGRIVAGNIGQKKGAKVDSGKGGKPGGRTKPLHTKGQGKPKPSGQDKPPVKKNNQAGGSTTIGNVSPQDTEEKKNDSELAQGDPSLQALHQETEIVRPDARGQSTEMQESGQGTAGQSAQNGAEQNAVPQDASQNAQNAPQNAPVQGQANAQPQAENASQAPQNASTGAPAAQENAAPAGGANSQANAAPQAGNAPLPSVNQQMQQNANAVQEAIQQRQQLQQQLRALSNSAQNIQSGERQKKQSLRQRLRNGAKSMAQKMQNALGLRREEAAHQEANTPTGVSSETPASQPQTVQQAPTQNLNGQAMPQGVSSATSNGQASQPQQATTNKANPPSPKQAALGMTQARPAAGSITSQQFSDQMKAAKDPSLSAEEKKNMIADTLAAAPPGTQIQMPVDGMASTITKQQNGTFAVQSRDKYGNNVDGGIMYNDALAGQVTENQYTSATAPNNRDRDVITNRNMMNNVDVGQNLHMENGDSATRFTRTENGWQMEVQENGQWSNFGQVGEGQVIDTLRDYQARGGSSISTTKDDEAWGNQASQAPQQDVPAQAEQPVQPTAEAQTAEAPVEAPVEASAETGASTPQAQAQNEFIQSAQPGQSISIDNTRFTRTDNGWQMEAQNENGEWEDYGETDDGFVSETLGFSQSQPNMKISTSRDNPAPEAASEGAQQAEATPLTETQGQAGGEVPAEMAGETPAEVPAEANGEVPAETAGAPAEVPQGAPQEAPVQAETPQEAPAPADTQSGAPSEAPIAPQAPQSKQQRKADYYYNESAILRSPMTDANQVKSMLSRGAAQMMEWDKFESATPDESGKNMIINFNNGKHMSFGLSEGGTATVQRARQMQAKYDQAKANGYTATQQMQANAPQTAQEAPQAAPQQGQQVNASEQENAPQAPQNAPEGTPEDVPNETPENPEGAVAESPIGEGQEGQQAEQQAGEQVGSETEASQPEVQNPEEAQIETPQNGVQQEEPQNVQPVPDAPKEGENTQEDQATRSYSKEEADKYISDLHLVSNRNTPQLHQSQQDFVNNAQVGQKLYAGRFISTKAEDGWHVQQLKEDGTLSYLGMTDPEDVMQFLLKRQANPNSYISTSRDRDSDEGAEQGGGQGQQDYQDPNGQPEPPQQPDQPQQPEAPQQPDQPQQPDAPQQRQTLRQRLQQYMQNKRNQGQQQPEQQQAQPQTPAQQFKNSLPSTDAPDFISKMHEALGKIGITHEQRENNFKIVANHLEAGHRMTITPYNERGQPLTPGRYTKGEDGYWRVEKQDADGNWKQDTQRPVISQADFVVLAAGSKDAEMTIDAQNRKKPQQSAPPAQQTQAPQQPQQAQQAQQQYPQQAGGLPTNPDGSPMTSKELMQYARKLRGQQKSQAKAQKASQKAYEQQWKSYNEGKMESARAKGRSDIASAKTKAKEQAAAVKTAKIKQAQAKLQEKEARKAKARAILSGNIGKARQANVALKNAKLNTRSAAVNTNLQRQKASIARHNIGNVRRAAKASIGNAATPDFMRNKTMGVRQSAAKPFQAPGMQGRTPTGNRGSTRR